MNTKKEKWTKEKIDRILKSHRNWGLKKMSYIKLSQEKINLIVAAANEVNINKFFLKKFLSSFAAREIINCASKKEIISLVINYFIQTGYMIVKK